VQLNILSSEENFWDDQEKARRVMQELEGYREEVEKIEQLERNVHDLCQLSEIVEASEERAQIEEQMNDVRLSLEKMEFLTLFSGKYDRHDAIVTLHAGAGGADAQDWSEMLLTMYLKWAEGHAFSVSILDKIPGAEAGIKSATIEVKGRWAYGHMRAESGVHRLVRLSPFNSDNLRQTSFARVDVMPVVETIKEVTIDMGDVRVDTYRASGAGGQHVNTTDSAVRVTHEPTGLQAQCQSERSQAQNKENALKLLTAKLHQKYLTEKEEEQKKITGERVEAAWGNQIRSYVLHPYKMVKDHRTKYETPHIEKILGGDIDEFIVAFLRL
jgi:peptide chain release factor 2